MAPAHEGVKGNEKVVTLKEKKTFKLQTFDTEVPLNKDKAVHKSNMYTCQGYSNMVDRTRLTHYSTAHEWNAEKRW